MPRKKTLKVNDKNVRLMYLTLEQEKLREYLHVRLELMADEVKKNEGAAHRFSYARDYVEGVLSSVEHNIKGNQEDLMAGRGDEVWQQP